MIQAQMGNVVLFSITLMAGNAPLDVSAETVTLVFLKPDNKTRLEKAMSYSTNGKDGVVNYSTLPGDLNMPGIWQLQVRIGTSLHTTRDTFEVMENL